MFKSYIQKQKIINNLCRGIIVIELSLSLKKIEEEINFAKGNLRKLSNLISGTKKEIKNYEVKLKKYAKQKDEVGFKKIEVVLKNLQVRLDDSQKELNILNDKYDAKTIKMLQEEKKSILSKINKLSTFVYR